MRERRPETNSRTGGKTSAATAFQSSLFGERADTIPSPALVAVSTNSLWGRVKSPRSAQHYIGVGNTTTDGDLQSTTHTRDKHSGQQFGATSLIAAAFLEAQFAQPGPTCQSHYPLAQLSNCDCAKRRNLHLVPFRDDRWNPCYVAFHNRGPLRHIVHVSFSFRCRQPTMHLVLICYSENTEALLCPRLVARISYRHTSFARKESLCSFDDKKAT